MTEPQVVAASTFSVAAISSPGKHRLQLHVMDDVSGPVMIPALVAKARRPGPTLFAVAGVHGDEYEGMEAIRQVFQSLDLDQLRGTFVALPSVNPFAFAARTRVAPPHIDGLNLARIFPGDARGSPSQVLAHHLLHLVLRNLTAKDLFVDFHSGSADVAFLSMIGFRQGSGPAREAAEEAARHFGLPRLWAIPDAPGPFNAETARRGIPTLGTETTGRAGCDPADVAEFVRGLDNLLTYMNIRDDRPWPPRFAGPPRPTTQVVAPVDGILSGGRRLNEEVAVGDRLGTLVSPFGEPIAEVSAPEAGTIWAMRTMPPVRQGELIALIARWP